MGVVYAATHPEIGKRVAIKVLAPHARRPRSDPPLQRRGARGQQNPPPEHHRHLRLQAAPRRAPLLRHGVPRGREPDGAPRARADGVRARCGGCSGRSAARWRRRTRRASCTATSSPTTSGWRRSTGPSRAQVARLRHRQAERSEQRQGHADRSLDGHAALHAARAGVGRAVDHRADIYALGVVLYQIFAGRLPFDGVTGHDIVLKHVTEAPPRPRATGRSRRRRWSESSSIVCRKSGLAAGDHARAERADRRRLRRRGRRARTTRQRWHDDPALADRGGTRGLHAGDARRGNRDSPRVGPRPGAVRGTTGVADDAA